MAIMFEKRVEKLEQALVPPGEIIVIESYVGHSGVGWSEPGCESEADVAARLQAAEVGPHDDVILIHAWGCERRGTPHTHAHDPVKRWPRRD
jgi:hypothetical protein